MSTRILSAFNLLKRVRFALLLLGGVAYGQPDSLWTRFYGDYYLVTMGTVIQTSDSGFLVIGNVSLGSNGGFHGLLIKTDAQGDTAWTRVSEFPGGDVFVDVVEGNEGFWVIGIVPDSLDGGNDIMLLLFDETGEVLSSNRFSWRNEISVDGFIRLLDGSFAITGYTRDEGDTNYFAHLTKLSPEGELVWIREYVWEPEPAFDGGPFPRDLAETEDGGFIISGKVTLEGGWIVYNRQAFLMRTDSIGELLWQRDYGGDGPGEELFNCVATYGNNTIIAAGRTHSIADSIRDDKLIVRTDSDGDTLWWRTLGGQYDDNTVGIVKTELQGVVLVGNSQNSMWQNNLIDLIKLDSNGVVDWSIDFDIVNDSPGNSEDAVSIQRTMDGGLILGANRDLLSGTDLAIVRFGPELSNAFPDTDPPLLQDLSLSVFPNPFNSSTHITLTLPPHIYHAELLVHNLLGQEVMMRELNAENGQAEFALDGTNLATGVYLVSARAGESIATQKLMLLK